jgi:uncharacterized BrkB/YihY/UPF0761 family membrane protein
MRELPSVDNNQLTILLTVLGVFGVFVLVIGVVIVAGIIQHKREKERTLHLQSTARLLGLEFAPNAPLNWIPKCSRSSIRVTLKLLLTFCMANWME